MADLQTIDDKLKFYAASIEYLRDWVQENEKLAVEITKLLRENLKTDNSVEDLKFITHYHLEIAKIIYSSIALIDKVDNTQIKLEKWKSDLENLK